MLAELDSFMTGVGFKIYLVVTFIAKEILQFLDSTYRLDLFIGNTAKAFAESIVSFCATPA